jgi:hypothetical protein
MLECGWIVAGLWFVVCGRVSKFGSRICLSGELVLEFNDFLKVSCFQIFKYVWIGSRQSCIPKRDLAGSTFKNSSCSRQKVTHNNTPAKMIFIKTRNADLHPIF